MRSTFSGASDGLITSATQSFGAQRQSCQFQLRTGDSDERSPSPLNVSPNHGERKEFYSQCQKFFSFLTSLVRTIMVRGWPRKGRSEWSFTPVLVGNRPDSSIRRSVNRPHELTTAFVPARFEEPAPSHSCQQPAIFMVRGQQQVSMGDHLLVKEANSTHGQFLAGDIHRRTYRLQSRFVDGCQPQQSRVRVSNAVTSIVAGSCGMLLQQACYRRCDFRGVRREWQDWRVRHGQDHGFGGRIEETH